MLIKKGRVDVPLLLVVFCFILPATWTVEPDKSALLSDKPRSSHATWKSNVQHHNESVRILISETPNIVLLGKPPILLLESIPGKDELIKFGTQLLDDWTGSKVTSIVENQVSVYRIAREICRQWLEGKGKQPVTWNTLINVLKQVQLMTLASHIEKSINKRTLSIPVAPYANSEIILNTARILKQEYSNQRVIEFNLLHNVSSMPFLNITMKDKVQLSKILDWQTFFNQVNSSTFPHRLLITGRPGAGKTTLL